MKLALTVVFCTFLALPVFSGSVTILGGYVMPEAKSDVYEQNEFETTFETGDLQSFGGIVRYDHFLGNFINLSGSISYYESDTSVVDLEFEFEDGYPIGRDIRLEIVPVEFNIHLLPAGREAAVIPFVGGGAGLYVWQYEEIGDFVINRFTDPEVITGVAYSDGADPGWHVEGGVHIPVARSVAVTVEAKYWSAKGDLDKAGFDPDFEPIDLSATMISGGVSIWF